MFNNCFQKFCHLLDNEQNYCRARQAINDNMAHVLYKLDN
jgi:hypothetical protein